MRAALSFGHVTRLSPIQSQGVRPHHGSSLSLCRFPELGLDLTPSSASSFSPAAPLASAVRFESNANRTRALHLQLLEASRRPVLVARVWRLVSFCLCESHLSFRRSELSPASSSGPIRGRPSARLQRQSSAIAPL